MPDFPVLDLESAPSEARHALEAAQSAFGFIPNLLGVMAHSPALAEAYLAVSALFDKTDLSPIERQVVLLTVSQYHGCHYCMAAHSAIAAMHKMPADVVAAIRENRSISDSKLQTLREMVHALVDSRGWPDENKVQAFLQAGYQPSHMMDILVGIAQKTLSNFSNHIAGTPLDQAFEEYYWTPKNSQIGSKVDP
jgi:uncharacterized peroxidase-related enzyme